MLTGVRGGQRCSRRRLQGCDDDESTVASLRVRRGRDGDSGVYAGSGLDSFGLVTKTKTARLLDKVERIEGLEGRVCARPCSGVLLGRRRIGRGRRGGSSWRGGNGAGKALCVSRRDYVDGRKQEVARHVGGLGMAGTQQCLCMRKTTGAGGGLGRLGDELGSFSSKPFLFLFCLIFPFFFCSFVLALIKIPNHFIKG